MSARRIEDVLAAHPPTYTEHAADPTTTFYCPPCSKAAGEWVTWTPAHVAQEIERIIAQRVASAERDECPQGMHGCTTTNPYRGDA